MALFRVGLPPIMADDDDDEDNRSGGRARRPPPSTCSCLETETYRNSHRRWALLSLALLIVSSSSGLVYGWPALRTQLLSESTGGSSLTEEQLGLIFTIGSWSTQGGRFFLGLARDRCGTRLVACASLIVTACGAVGVGVAAPDQLAAQSASLFAIGLGSGAQLCVQPVASLFPGHGGVVLSSLSGAFQVSGLVFLALTATTAADESKRRVSFLVFAACVLALVVLSAVLLPRGNSFHLQENALDESHHVKQNTSAEETKEDRESSAAETNAHRSKSTSGVDKEPALGFDNEALRIDTKKESNDEIGSKIRPRQNFTAVEQMKTAEYMLLCLWFSVCIVPLQYYVAIIGFQLEQLGDDAGLYTDVFSYCYAGAAAAAPLAGRLADRRGLGLAQGAATLLAAVPHFLLAARDVLGGGGDVRLRVQTVGLACYGLGRVGIFGLFFANCGTRFGYAHYGTLAGVGLLVTAVASLLQYPLIALTLAGHSTLVNSSLGAALVLQAPYFVWLHRKTMHPSASLISLDSFKVG